MCPLYPDPGRERVSSRIALAISAPFVNSNKSATLPARSLLVCAHYRRIDDVLSDEPPLQFVVRTTSLTSKSLVPSSPRSAARRAIARASSSTISCA
jgi:hypothetical protein